jgi:hypothetical protein
MSGFYLNLETGPSRGFRTGPVLLRYASLRLPNAVVTFFDEQVRIYKMSRCRPENLQLLREPLLQGSLIPD